MAAYIEIDGLRYVTPSKAWEPSETKPSTLRVTLSGALDVTYGPAILLEWRGEVEAPVTAITLYGTITDLITSLRKKQLLTFKDHYGTSYSADISGQMVRRSHSAGWSASSNIWFVSVTIKASV